MRRLLPAENDEHPADTVATEAVFDFLRVGRWRLAAYIAVAAREGCLSDYDKLLLRVNGWIARKHIDGLEAIRAEVESWQVAPLAPRFRLAKLALLDDVPAAHELGKALLDSGDLDIDDWWTWPLLEDVRAYDAEQAVDRHEDSSGALEARP